MVLPFFAANESDDKPITIFSEIEVAFFIRLRCPTWMISNVPPNAVKVNFTHRYCFI